MRFPPSLRRLFLPALAMSAAGPAGAQLSNYWPVNEGSGAPATTANLVGGGTNGTLNSGAAVVTDGVRGQVLEFNGAGSYVNAGTIAILSTASNFSWSFWANSSQAPAGNNNVIVGNRYSPTAGVDFSPREFVKFTPQQFEWHVNAGSQNTDYSDLPAGGWNHVAAVKQGNLFITYVNGIVNRTNWVSAGTNNPQPLYFGGDQTAESWAGRLDDVATWTSPLPAGSVVALAKGTVTPASAPTAAAALTTVFSDNFSSGLGNWTPTTRGLENNAAAGYNAPAVNGSNQAVLSGVTTSQYWFGSSLESVATFDATKATEVSVDRVSLTGSGTAFRSSLWILGDDAHYLHFSQNINEGGWSWNSRDDGGQGTLNATGAGNNLIGLDGLDADSGLHSMKIRMEPTGDPGDVNMLIYLDNVLYGAQGFTNFPSNFRVVLTGQGRAIGDSVNATFENVVVAQIPEPGISLLALLGAGVFLRRRR